MTWLKYSACIRRCIASPRPCDRAAPSGGVLCQLQTMPLSPLLEPDDHLANLDAILVHIGAVQHAVAAHLPHPVVEADPQRAIRHRQINRILPVEGVATLFTAGLPDHSRRAALPGLRSGLGQGPDPTLGAGIRVDEIFGQGQHLAIPLARNLHLEAPPHRAEPVLKLSIAHHMAVEKLLQLEIPRAQLFIRQIRPSGTGAQNHQGKDQKNSAHEKGPGMIIFPRRPIPKPPRGKVQARRAPLSTAAKPTARTATQITSNCSYLWPTGRSATAQSAPRAKYVTAPAIAAPNATR